MGMTKSVKKNYLYNLSYQILMILSPLIVTPYVSRILGAEGIGTYSFTQSIVSYFILLGTLGISMYAQREIAYLQKDKIGQSYIFWEIIIMKIFSIGISLLFFYIFIIRKSDYKFLYTIQMLDIVASLIDITWYFQGLEDFRKTVLRNFLIKIISIILVFLCVNKAEDLWIYILIHSGTLLLGQLSLWGYLPKFLRPIKIADLHIIKHIPIVFQLFIPQIAVQLYTVIDKTMIGLVTNSPLENGYYEQAQKLIKICLTFITSLGIVLIPRIAFAHSEKNIEMTKEYLKRSLQFVWFLGIPIMFGLIGISYNLVPWFFGKGFDKVSILIIMFSPLMIVIGMNYMMGTQLLAIGEQKIYTLSVVLGLILNVILNLMLIKEFLSLGAVVASVLAESLVALVQFVYIKKFISLKNLFLMSKKSFLSGFVMLMVLLFIEQKIISSFINTILLILLGIIIYIGILLILKDEFLLKIILKIDKYKKKIQ